MTRANEFAGQSVDQLQQVESSLKFELLHYVEVVAANAAERKRRREIRKDLARVLTLLIRKKS